ETSSRELHPNCRLVPASACHGLAESIEAARTAVEGLRISAIRQSSPDIPWTAVMRSTRRLAAILFSSSRHNSMTSTPRLYCAQASLVFAACESQGLNRATEWDYSALVLPRIWRLPCCAHGTAKCLSRPAAHRTASWRSL